MNRRNTSFCDRGRYRHRECFRSTRLRGKPVTLRNTCSWTRAAVGPWGKRRSPPRRLSSPDPSSSSTRPSFRSPSTCAMFLPAYPTRTRSCSVGFGASRATWSPPACRSPTLSTGECRRRQQSFPPSSAIQLIDERPGRNRGPSAPSFDSIHFAESSGSVPPGSRSGGGSESHPLQRSTSTSRFTPRTAPR